MRLFLLALTLVASGALSVSAQQPAEQRAGLGEAPTAYDAKGAAALEGHLLTTALNGSDESAETDTPGLRLRCTPASWRIVATNLLTRTYDAAKPTEAAPPPAETSVVEKTAPVNFIISIDGERHPIQVDRPIVLKLGNRNRKIVLHPVP